MSESKKCEHVLEQEFLATRARILDIAATLDRISRCDSDPHADVRWNLLQTALKIVVDGEPERAERVQMLFSRRYVENWQADDQFPREITGASLRKRQKEA